MGQAALKYDEAFDDAPETEAPDLDAHAHDELSHAVAHEWLELRSLVPWADVLPAGAERPYDVVRSYRWHDLEGGDMVCEVAVHERPGRQGHVVRRRCVIRR